MKKAIKFLTLLLVGIVMVFGIAGCKEKASGEVYSVKEAYDNGWLTQEDLMSIAYYLNGGRADNEEIISENYEPLPKTPDVLSDETEYKIKSAAAAEYREKYHIKDAKAKGFTITAYYGTYGDCVAVMTEDVYSGAATVVWTDMIAGVSFLYSSGISIQIWREDK